MSYKEKHKYYSGIGSYDDDKYDAVRDAKDKFYKNPGKYSSYRREGANSRTYSERNEGSVYTTARRSGRTEVVIEHWYGCSNQSVCDNLILAIEDNFSDVTVKEFSGRMDSFEVFINGKLLYSRLMQGGYPYEDEVLEAVYRARKGHQVHQIDRYGSNACTIL